MTNEESEANALKDALLKGEYEAQHFETNSFCLVNELKQLTLNDVLQVTSNMQQSLLNRCANPDECQKTENLVKQLREKYETAIEEYFKQMEPKISAIFDIPSHILLSEDETQEKQFTDDDSRDLNAEIKQLASQYRRAVCMESLLKKEKKACFNLDLVEKKLLELEDNVSTLLEIFQHNKRSLTTVMDEFLELTDLMNQIGSISLKKNKKVRSDFVYFSNKIFRT